MRARPVLFAALAALLALGGCTASPDGPPPVLYGKSACAECRMIINEARYAASALSEKGEPALFDSVECLAAYLKHEGPPRMWVHDYERDTWLPAEGAFYVVSPELTTPMGKGMVAMAEAADAERLAGRVHGRVLRFEQLRRE